MARRAGDKHPQHAGLQYLILLRHFATRFNKTQTPPNMPLNKGMEWRHTVTALASQHSMGEQAGTVPVGDKSTSLPQAPQLGQAGGLFDCL